MVDIQLSKDLLPNHDKSERDVMSCTTAALLLAVAIAFLNKTLHRLLNTNAAVSVHVYAACATAYITYFPSIGMPAPSCPVTSPLIWTQFSTFLASTTFLTTEVTP